MVPGISLLWQTVDVVSHEILKENVLDCSLDEQTGRCIEKGVTSWAQKVGSAVHSGRPGSGSVYWGSVLAPILIINDLDDWGSSRWKADLH